MKKLLTMLRPKLTLNLTEAPVGPWSPAPYVPPQPKPKSFDERIRELRTKTDTSTGTGCAYWPITCGVHNRHFEAEIELRGDTVILLRNRLTGNAPSTGGVAPALDVLGHALHFDARPDWKCPYCNARDNPGFTWLVWQCGCGGHIQCAGTIGRKAWCGCGMFEDRVLPKTKGGDKRAWEIRGTRERASAAVPRLAALPTPITAVPRIAAVPRLPAPAAPRIAASPSSTPLLPWRR